jgi:hypothetical protein
MPPEGDIETEPLDAVQIGEVVMPVTLIVSLKLVTFALAETEHPLLSVNSIV